MPMYACKTCRVRFFAHDTAGRVCPAGCRKAMYMANPEMTVSQFRVVPDTKKPIMNFGPKYDGQIVLALIDGETVKYNGGAVTQENVYAFMHDPSVPQADKAEYSRQEGERQSAEYLHEKHEDAANHRLCIVENYQPNTEEQKEKIRSALAEVPRQGGKIRLYIVAHHDPESRRMAGLDASTLAALIGNSPHAAYIKLITLVGCHTAGEAHDADAVPELLAVQTFASEFHRRLGEAHRVYTFVNGYTTLIQINVRGQKQTRFDDKAKPQRKLAFSKVRFYWDEYKRQAQTVVYTE